MTPAADSANLRTEISRQEQFRDRWSSYGGSAGLIELSESLAPSQLKKYELFQSYDDKFLEKISPDITLAKWRAGSVLFEEGSYIDISFYIVSGDVQIFLRKHDELAAQNQAIFDPNRTAAPGELQTQAADMGMTQAAQTVLQTQIQKQDTKSGEITFLSTMDFNLSVGERKNLPYGAIFGETGALIGWPQSATAQTLSECELIQVRAPAVRMMKRKSSALKEKIDKHYREQALFAQLKGAPLFASCDDSFVDGLKDRVELVSCEPGEVLTKEGAPADKLYMVRSGFVKLSQKIGDGDIVVSYLSKGMTLGETELLIDGLGTWTSTATSVQNTELIAVSRPDFVDLTSRFPKAEKLLWTYAVSRIKESGFHRENIGLSELMNTALDQGLVEGNSVLVIDLDVCTRCDDCVRACASTHQGIPRFVREGNKYGNLLITRACYHCRDPVCLIGCPTGAIRRSNIGDIVEIDDKLCIGCRTCANNCPYDAIVMHETGKNWADNTIPEGLRGKPRLLATKCDLCKDTGHGPACVSNCPHDCAIRVGSVEEFQEVLNIS